MGERSNGSMRLLLAAIACFWSSLYLYVPTLTPYAEAIGAPMGMVGLIVASYGFSQLVLRIPVGLWSDAIARRRPFLLAGFVTAVLAGVLFALSESVWGLLAARTLSGVSATMWVVITVLFSSYFPPERAGYAMSLVTFATTVSQLVSTLAGGLIAELWGWHAPFWAAALVGGAGLALAGRTREAGARPVGLTPRQLAAVGREPSLLLVSGLAALYQFNVFTTTYGFTPNYAVELGASKAALGWLGLVSTLPTAIASLASGSILARRFSEGQLVTAGAALTCLGTLAIPLCTGLPALFVTQAVGGFGRGLVFAVLMGLAIKSVPSERRATAMGFFQSIYAVGMFAGPAVAGVMADSFGLQGAFYTAAAVMAVATAIAGGWLPRFFPKEAPAARAVSSS